MSYYDQLTQVVVTCFRHSLSEVNDLMMEHLMSEPGSRWAFIEERFEPSGIYFPSPLEGGIRFLGFALWEPVAAKGRCAFITNSSDGLFNLISKLHRKHGVDCLFLRYTRSATEHGVAEFIRLLPNGTERLVRSLQEDQWQFYVDGPVLPFEEVSHYQRRRIKDRVSEDLLVRYAVKLGWEIKSDDFWRSETPALLGREAF